MKITVQIILAIQFSVLSVSCVFKPDLAAIEAQLLPFPAPVVSDIQPAALFTGGGTEVQITGENFAAGVSVKLNGEDCQISKLVGSTKIVCLAPASAEGSFEALITGVDGKTATIGVTYDRLAYTKLSLLVGKLILPVTNSDGYFNNGDSIGATQMFVDGNLIYSADYDGNKIKSTNLANLFSQSVVGRGVNSGPDIAVASPTLVSLSNPACVAKSGNFIFFCLSDLAIAKMDLTSSVITLVAGRIPADGNVYLPGDPLGDNFDHIRRIFIVGTTLYVVDVDTIKKIDLLTPALTTIAGTSGAGVTADGTGAVATFLEITEAEILGNKLYVMDQDFYSGVLRVINLDPLSSYAVATVLGNASALPGFGVEAVDGTGAAASLNNVRGISAFGTKLIIVDEYNGTRVKIRVFDPTAGSIVSVKSIATSTKHVMGSLSDKARLRSYYIRGIKYIENYGLILGTVYGMLRVQ